MHKGNDIQPERQMRHVGNALLPEYACLPVVFFFPTWLPVLRMPSITGPAPCACLSVYTYCTLRQLAYFPPALPPCWCGIINPRRACAARVTVVVLCVCLCVCVCVQAAHLRLTQLSDKLDILTDLVSWWLQNEFGVFLFLPKLELSCASTQPFCMHARAPTQANVSGTRVWLYLLQHARARASSTHSPQGPRVILEHTTWWIFSSRRSPEPVGWI